MKHKVLILMIILATAATVWSRPPSHLSPRMAYLSESHSLRKAAAIDTNATPTAFGCTWVGVGNLARIPFNNIGENGYFSIPATWDGTYDGTLYSGWYTSNPILDGEYPAGSKQYYIWDAGLWVGAKVPVQTSSGTIYDERVASCAYYSDLGSMFPVYTSTQIIPTDDDHGGEYLFVQPGQTQQSYQESWIFTDTSLNERRRQIEQEKGLVGLVVNPGDIISNQDGYTIFGDYVPEKEASFVYSKGYDTDPVGVKVVMRSYSWGYDYNKNYVYLDYYITNMNSFPLKDVAFGYFMDTDIGDSDSPQGAYDDLIGYDESLELGYCYDSDLFEPQWSTQSGYIGVTFVGTPNGTDGKPLGLTGFQTWTQTDEEGQLVDDEKNDAAKYAQLVKGGYELYQTPQDVRMLPCSGPILNFEPGQTAHVVIALVVGNSLAELKENAQKAITQYQNAYVGPTAPPAPRYTVTPADNKVYIRWDDFPENVPDPMSAELDFEGYRIYRSTTGIAGDWKLIADFDVAGNTTGKTVIAKYSKGNSTATIGYAGLKTDGTDYFKEAQYTIEFLTDTTLMVYNVSNLESYPYRRDAKTTGSGFCVINPDNNKVEVSAVYRSGYWIYFDGIYIKISNGTIVKPDDDPTPNRGDVFLVQTYSDKEIGNQTGLQYAYTDSALTNGLTYYYSMTSYDRGNLEQGIASLETGIELNKTTVIPMNLGVDVNDVRISKVDHLAGVGTGTVVVSLVDPAAVTGHNYQVTFHKATADQKLPLAKSWKLTDLTDNRVIMDSITNLSGQSNPLVDGFSIKVTTPANPSFDSTYWKIGQTTYNFNVLLSATPDPFDYEIRFTQNGSSDKRGMKAPFEVWNMTIDSQHICATDDKPGFVFVDKDRDEAIDSGDFIYILKKYENGNAVQILLSIIDASRPPVVGDVFRITTKKPFQTNDRFEFSTVKLKSAKTDYSLDQVKVVPNPYYIRADWDLNRFEQKLFFRNLPSACRIRIFNTAGVLIKTIEYSSTTQNGSVAWNMRTDENLNCTNGLYIYQVEDSASGKTVTGKFAIVR
ncbi:MAG: hypothetical protein KBA26_07025 [Candidatus Delongbacteria bacterium]|nr:hypothetical protein [Candidatus Delongbacteria bacterium]